MEFKLPLFFRLARQTAIQERSVIDAVALLQHRWMRRKKKTLRESISSRIPRTQSNQIENAAVRRCLAAVVCSTADG
jgi:hypothetical protein